MDECKLRAANEIHGVDCDAERCVYWRVVEAAGIPVSDEGSAGCAIQYFELLEGEDAGVARWLLSVKDRIEGLAGTPDSSTDRGETPR
jgi:hypothetical protein